MFVKDDDYWKAKKESKDGMTKVIKVWSGKEEAIHDAGFANGAEFGYNKVNEWHYVKNGDLPKTGNPCLVYLVNDCALVARLREDNVWTIDGHNAFENVIAWKEIVPPKESY